MFFDPHGKRLTIFSRRMEKGAFFGERFLILEYSGDAFRVCFGSSEKREDNQKLLLESRNQIGELLLGLPAEIAEFYRKLEGSDPDFAEYLKIKLGEFSGRKLSEEEARSTLSWRPKKNENGAYFLTEGCPHFKSSNFEKVILEILEVLKDQKDYRKIKILMEAAKHKLGNRLTEYLSEVLRAKRGVDPLVKIGTIKKEHSSSFLELEKIAKETLEKVTSLLSIESELSKS